MVTQGSLTIQFLGAAQSATGSKYLLGFRGRYILVDCGLMGPEQLRLQSPQDFPADLNNVEAVVLTDAHLDHSGYIPRLVKHGFRGKIYCTEATKALAEIILADSGYLQEEEAEYFNCQKLGVPHAALFSKGEALDSFGQFETRAFGVDFEVSEGFRCCFLYAGHTLGAASLVVRVGGTTLGFSGNVGRPKDPVFYPPALLPQVDHLVLESTYGDRLHPRTSPMFTLADIIRDAAERKGVVLIPAFTLGRAQRLLFLLWQTKKERRIPDIPVFLNSPLAEHVTEAFIKFRALHRLTELECREILEAVHVVHDANESEALNLSTGPKIIVSAGGMATGARILHHFKAFASDKNSAIVLAGYQAPGTPGAALLAGAREIAIQGQTIPIKARVHALESLSTHADYSETLDWLSRSRANPRKVFVTHGQPSAVRAMAWRLKENLDLNAEVPELLQTVELV